MSNEEVKTTETNGKGVVHVPPGEAEAVWAAGDTYTFLGTVENTGGSLELTESVVPPGGGPPPHVHRRTDEAFYVLEGEIEFSEGKRAFVAGPGSFVFVPKGAMHAFKNVGTGTARMMAMAIPAGLEGLVREVGQPAGEGAAPPISPEQIERMIALAPKYDTEMVPPPQDRPPVSDGSGRA